jgi:5-hydroxyisourate hydrolase
MADAGGALTVHVLDAARGRPAVAMRLTLFRLTGPARISLGEHATNPDGRCDSPLLAGAALLSGLYEIEFSVGAWRAAQGEPQSGFYDTIPIRFRVDDPVARYHVPLILSPYGYATYRGS